MARLFLSAGESFGTLGASSKTDVFGTAAGAETVTVAANGKASFDPSFNRGGDTINILGNAGLYVIHTDLSNAFLTGDNGGDIAIPVGTVGITIAFNDASRTLRYDGTNVVLGSQIVDFAGVFVTPGTAGQTMAEADSQQVVTVHASSAAASDSLVQVPDAAQASNDDSIGLTPAAVALLLGTMSSDAAQHTGDWTTLHLG
jgi:hypothetical protein